MPTTSSSHIATVLHYPTQWPQPQEGAPQLNVHFDRTLSVDWELIEGLAAEMIAFQGVQEMLREGTIPQSLLSQYTHYNQQKNTTFYAIRNAQDKKTFLKQTIDHLKQFNPDVESMLARWNDMIITRQMNHLTDVQKKYFQDAASQWEKIANLHFTYHPNEPHHIAVFSSGMKGPIYGFDGIAYNVLNSLSSDIAGAVQHDPVHIVVRNAGFHQDVILHEIGHALGLDHPHTGQHILAPRHPFAHTGMTVMSYSTLSYKDEPVFSSLLDHGSYWVACTLSNLLVHRMLTDNPAAIIATGSLQIISWLLLTASQISLPYKIATPMPLDIMAMHAIYGENNETGLGNDGYTIHPNGGAMTIYDHAGEDSITIADDETIPLLRLAHFISLVPRHSAEGVGARYMFHIFNGHQIENVYINMGNSFVVGNQGDNLLSSQGFGKKIFIPSQGQDEVRGGVEENHYLFFEGDGHTTIHGFGPQDMLWFFVAPNTMLDTNHILSHHLTCNATSQQVAIDLDMQGVTITVNAAAHIPAEQNIQVVPLAQQPHWLRPQSTTDEVEVVDPYVFFEAVQDCGMLGSFQPICEEFSVWYDSVVPTIQWADQPWNVV